MHEQAYNPPPDTGQSPAGDVERLTAELSKWQERVPKLSAALRERTIRVKSLEQRLQELEQLDSSDPSDAGIKARDELIEELEAKIKELNTLHQAARGKLHSGGLEIDELHAEVQSWKEKWQALTQSLDDQACVVARQESDLKNQSAELDTVKSKLVAHVEELDDKAHQIQTLENEVESLNRRNENLFETTELANRQIGTLGDNLNALRGEVREKDQAAVETASELDALKDKLETETQKSLAKDEDIGALLARVETRQKEIDALSDKLVEHEALLVERDRSKQELDRQRENLEQQLGDIDSLTKTVARLADFEQSCAELEELADRLREESDGLKNTLAERDVRVETLVGEFSASREEVTRLVADAEGATASYDEERREFSKQIADKEERVQQLEAQLGERSNLVLGLEQEKLDVQETLRALELEKDQLSGALAKAERHAQEYADHIGQLDDKLHRQQELMLSLEEELAQAQQTVVTQEQEQTKVLSEKDERIGVLTEEIETHNHSEAVIEEQFEELKKSQESALAESQALISVGREELEKLQTDLKSASEDANRFENALAQAIAAAKEMEKDRDDFTGRVDLLESELRDQKRVTAKVEQTLKAANKLVGKRKSPEVDTEEANSLQLEVQKLEQMVRDRTEQLNQAQWRQHMAVKDVESSPIEGKMMVVLNQQLVDARASNERLLEQVRELKGGRRNKTSIESDDLTKIHGVGAKLAKQLNSLGIFRYEQIAGLDERALASESHVLYPHKGRILHDDWIQQAAKLAR